MTKVYPRRAAATVPPAAIETMKPSTTLISEDDATVLTVWKKSLLLNCNGFTVFDARGYIVFRVDNYVADHRREIVLMDAAGKPLLTIRRKKLSLGDKWLVSDGESAENPRFAVWKPVNLLSSRNLAQVTACDSNKNAAAYQIEGSYVQRCVTVWDGDRRRVEAEIRQKEGVGADVFRLVVRAGMDNTFAMALVIVLDQMFASPRRRF